MACETNPDRAESWGFLLKSSCLWSLFRSWFRPHRGVSQEKLLLYLGFFECVHNAKKRGKALLD